MTTLKALPIKQSLHAFAAMLAFAFIAAMAFKLI